MRAPVKTMFQAGCLLSAFALTGCPPIGQIVRKYGFTEMRPPSSLLEPGTIVVIKSKQPFSAGIVCTQRASLGEDFKPVITPTADESLRKLSNSNITLGADYLSLIKADASFSVIDGIEAKFDNPLIYTVSDVDIMQSLDKRDPVCSRAIANRRRADYELTMISSALMADVTYTVNFNRQANLSGQAQIAVLQGLAPKLGIQNGSLKQNTISGKKLIWGIIDDPYLLAMSLPGTFSASAPGPLPSRTPDDERKIPQEVIAQFEGEPDAF